MCPTGVIVSGALNYAYREIEGVDLTLCKVVETSNKAYLVRQR